MRLFAVTLFAVLALASPAFATPVTNVTVDNTQPSNAAGARTVYTITFTTSATGALSETANSRINITLPATSSHANWTSGTVTVAGTAVGYCSRLTDPSLECWLSSGRTIAASTTVTVTLDGITNPSSSGNFSIFTTADTTPVPLGVTVVGAQPITGLTVANTIPTNAAGARTVYTITFTTSATGALSETANSRINITFPAGTSLANWTGGTVTVAGTTVGYCSRLTDPKAECWLSSDKTIAANTTVTLTFEGITNPTSNGTLDLATTSDPAPQPKPVTVVGAQPITGLTVANTIPTNAAGARTVYTITFTTSATGALSETANSRINITLPATSSHANWTSGTVTVAGTTVGYCSRLTDPSLECWLSSGRTIAASTTVTVTLEGITNPTSNGTLNLATTSDPAPQPKPVTVVGAQPITGLTVANTIPTNAAGARTVYTITFTTSATGGLSETANSRINITFPAGTSLANWTGGTVTVAGTTVGYCSRLTDPKAECWLSSDKTIAANTTVTLTFEGITNPTSNGTLDLATTSDPAPQPKPVTVVGAQPITGLTVAASSLTPSAITRHVVRFTASSTGALSEDANSRIRFTLPAGTGFANWTGTVHDETAGANVGFCSRLTGTELECWLSSGQIVGSEHTLRITFENITNPPTPGPYQMNVSTTSDPPVVTSANYTQGQALPPETAIESGTSSGTTTTFTFSAAEPGSRLECRIDDAPFTLCTSPYTTPVLPPGAHTFQVRALDAAGTPDLTPATRTFTVAGGPTPTPVPTTTAPSPTPTATPSPTPTPEFKKDVVVSPVSGTVSICDKPGGKCTKLTAGAAIPMGSTVDARKGAVELTSIAAAGAPPQTARFYDGMFKVTQTGSTTDLTLNEPLAPCSSKKARAAAKKPKSRKLWGDGKGKFRTRGQYAAATIRGTKWLVQDSCAGTLVKVDQGVVSVEDYASRKKVTVRAKKSYTAKPRRR